MSYDYNTTLKPFGFQSIDLDELPQQDHNSSTAAPLLAMHGPARATYTAQSPTVGSLTYEAPTRTAPATTRVLPSPPSSFSLPPHMDWSDDDHNVFFSPPALIDLIDLPVDSAGLDGETETARLAASPLSDSVATPAKIEAAFRGRASTPTSEGIEAASLHNLATTAKQQFFMTSAKYEKTCFTDQAIFVKYFAFLEETCLKISIESIEVKLKALQKILYLLKFDPITEDSSFVICAIIRKIASWKIGEKEKQALYPSIVSCFLKHLKKGNLQGAFPGLENLLSNQRYPQQEINLRYVHEWQKQLRNQEEAILRLKQLDSMKDDSKNFLELHEAVYLIQEWGDEVIGSSGSPFALSRIDSIARFVFQKVFEKEEQVFPILVNAAHVCQQIISYYKGEDEQVVYQASIRGDLEKPGLTALIPLLNRVVVKDREQIEDEIMKIIFRIIDDVYPQKFACATQEVFEEGLLATLDSVESERVRGRLLRKLKKTPVMFSQMERGWEKRIRESLLEIDKEIQSLESDKRVDTEEIELIQQRIQELKEERRQKFDFSFKEAIEVISKIERVQKRKEEVRIDKPLNELLLEAQDDYDPFGYLMTDPVETPSGYLYHKEGILAWILAKGTDPITGAPLKEEDLKSIQIVKEEVLERQRSRRLPSYRCFKPEKSSVHAELFHAIKASDLPGVYRAIRKGAHPEYFKDSQGKTALELATILNKDIFQKLSLLAFEDPLNWGQKDRKMELQLNRVQAIGKEVPAISNTAAGTIRAIERAHVRFAEEETHRTREKAQAAKHDLTEARKRFETEVEVARIEAESWERIAGGKFKTRKEKGYATDSTHETKGQLSWTQNWIEQASDRQGVIKKELEEVNSRQILINEKIQSLLLMLGEKGVEPLTQRANLIKKAFAETKGIEDKANKLLGLQNKICRLQIDLMKRTVISLEEAIDTREIQLRKLKLVTESEPQKLGEIENIEKEVSEGKSGITWFEERILECSK